MRLYKPTNYQYCCYISAVSARLQVIRSNMVYENVIHDEESNMWIGPRPVCYYRVVITAIIIIIIVVVVVVVVVIIIAFFFVFVVVLRWL